MGQIDISESRINPGSGHARTITRPATSVCRRIQQSACRPSGGAERSKYSNTLVFPSLWNGCVPRLSVFRRRARSPPLSIGVRCPSTTTITAAPWGPGREGGPQRAWNRKKMVTGRACPSDPSRPVAQRLLQAPSPPSSRRACLRPQSPPGTPPRDRRHDLIRPVREAAVQLPRTAR